eukprot:gene9862-20511_t
MKSCLDSKCKFLRFFALMQVHIVLIFGFLLFQRGNAATTTARTKQNIRGGCPITATKLFFGKQMTLLGQSFSSGTKMFLGENDVRDLTNKNWKPTLISSSLSSRAMRIQNLNMAVTTNPETEVKAEKTSNRKPAGPLEVIVLGLSHHNAAVDVREKLAIPEDKWAESAGELCKYNSIAEAAVLSTCNRFEVYIAGVNQYECIRDAVDYFLNRAGGSLDQIVLRKNLFMLSGEDAVWHILKVSAGLDSLVVGEGQILAQVKRAYEHGIEEGGQAGKVVSRLLNTAVAAGKRVRTETGISRGAVSISSAAAEFSAMKVMDTCGIAKIADANIAIIGAGKMARLLLVHLQTQDVKEITIVNRSPERVEELRAEFPDLKINLRLMPDMWDVIRESDIVYPSTAATTTIIDPEPLADCLSTRSRPGGLQLVDISVPRNVHGDCGQLPMVSSYNVDNLKEVVERNTAKRRREMVEAEGILREEMDKYRLWQQSLGAIPTIARLQEKAEGLRLEELQKASKKLANLTPKDLEAVDRLSKGIVAKLLHGPMNHLRAQKEVDATRAAIKQVQEAFQLE